MNPRTTIAASASHGATRGRFGVVFAMGLAVAASFSAPAADLAAGPATGSACIAPVPLATAGTKT